MELECLAYYEGEAGKAIAQIHVLFCTDRQKGFLFIFLIFMDILHNITI